jgi:AraC family transcriptional regulator of adaptative response/methylated-DNA-[protein]-cysteine methyltransferase
MARFGVAEYLAPVMNKRGFRPGTRRRWWRAALFRDTAYDEVFVFGVTTTAIYCRPGCPARRPHLRNVVFFRSPRDAEGEGYRACKRCGPDPRRGPRGGVLAACEWIARHGDELPSLERIARRVGWSPFHLQKVFRRSLGVTPKQYARRLRFQRFGRRVGSGGPVASALYAAGFGSSRGLYERSFSQLGMSPAALARKGLGMSIAYDVLDCPLGKALIAATPLGICAVEFGSRANDLSKSLRGRFPGASIARAPDLLRFARECLRKIFSGEAKNLDLPLDIRATAFQARVWETLCAIPYGQTRTYAQVARSIGRRSAVRAVARACASNPVALVIPCHRVQGAEGGLRGYRWGIARKKALLELERGRHGKTQCR